MSEAVTPLTPAQQELAEEQASKEGYVRRDLVGLDQFGNVITGGLPGETISSRMERWDTEDKGVKHLVGEAVSDGLDLLQPKHGELAEAGDTERALKVASEEEATGDLPIKQ